MLQCRMQILDERLSTHCSGLISFDKLLLKDQAMSMSWNIIYWVDWNIIEEHMYEVYFDDFEHLFPVAGTKKTLRQIYKNL